ncbi:MAG: SpoIID/LytB domain-containing protein [Thermacetogeniaceae bacterium]
MATHYIYRSLILCLLALLLTCLGAPRQAGATTTAAGGSSSTAGSAAGTTGIPILRVALNEGVPGASFSVAQGSYTLTDESTGVSLGTAAPSGAWTITAAGTTMLVQGPGGNSAQPYNGPIALQAASGGSGGDQPDLFCYKGVQYRGSLVIQILNKNLLVLNVLDVESYLYGVVGEEMGGGAPSGAYCAQAVASRSYALSMRGLLSPWYDVSTGSQAYGGYTGEQEFAGSGDNPVVDAVQRTSGQVLEYAGALVRAYFHANAGGYTEDAENVWAISEPYLKGVPSDGDAYADTLGSWAQSTYTWTETCDRSDLGAQLGVGKILDIKASCNRTQVTTDPATGSTTVQFIPGTATVSGRVTQLTVVGTNGTMTYNRDNIRQALGLKSTLFDVDVGGQLEALDAQGQTDALSGDEVCVQGQDGPQQTVSLGSGSLYILGSGNRLVTQSASSDEITFSGHGDGHGVGMSQWGAIGMAENGDNYQTILELYYDQGKNDGNLQIVNNYGA